MENNKDLLDLCQLNLMEEHIEDSVHSDRDSTLKLIDYKKRELVHRIKNQTEEIKNEKRTIKTY